MKLTIILFLILPIVLLGCTQNKIIAIPSPCPPAYIFSHTNETIKITGAAEWTNITFGQENSELKSGIEHKHQTRENDTFTVVTGGIYNIDYDIDLEDTGSGANTVDVAARMIYQNGSELEGSVFETDITKQGAEAELSHNFLERFVAGDEVIFQFIGDDADVQISTHGTFGEFPESATIIMHRISCET